MYIFRPHLLRPCLQVIREAGKQFFNQSKFYHNELESLFATKRDHYGGIHYDTNRADPGSLRSIGPERLSAMIKQTFENDPGKRAIWFEISPANTFLIEPLVKLGFTFHHVKDANVIMVKSLVERNAIPSYAYTNVGVGGLVVNDQDHVLVVREKNFTMKTKFWKLPGGYVEQGEDLDQAVCREVFEETGIQTQFQSVLVMRHMHNVSFAFGCSDFYFVCCLRPVAQTEEITQCPHEIEQCEWVSLDRIQEHFSKFNNFVIGKYLEWKSSHIEIGYDKVESNFWPVVYNVYSTKNKNKS